MMPRFYLAVIFACFAIGAFCQTITGSFLHDGIQRNYRLHLPPNFQPSEKLPLIFNLHGFTSNALQQELYSGMNAVADTARFLVCYPDGIGNAWNIGVAGGSTADDLGFIAALIDSIQVQYGIDPERVYSCGMSNGGFFSYRLACEMGDRIAAIASVAGSMTTAMLDACSPVRPIPIMQVHGNADPVVDFNGSAFNAGVLDVVDFWVSQNNCTGSPTTGDFPDLVTTDQATASFDQYLDCDEDSEVVLITIENGGHTWPGAFPTVVFGATCQDLNASREIWLFFRKHQLDLAVASEEVQLPAGDQLVVYPNPFTNSINMRYSSRDICNMAVYGLNGQVVWHGALASPIDTQNWPSGLYLFKIIDSKGTHTRRMIKL